MQQHSSQHFPQVNAIRCLTVSFRESIDIQRLIQIDVVTDYDYRGQIVGVEVLNLEFHAKADLFANVDWNVVNKLTGMRFSFDKKNDAFYVAISPDERSINQRVHSGRLVLNGRNELVSIEAMLPDE
jgi:uncharacterized protein YuzE